jgi:hypothetical protein
MNDQIKKTLINELAEHFDERMGSKLVISKLPDGSYTFKDFIIKRQYNQNWALYDTVTDNLLHEFFLVSCALIAAKEYYNIQFQSYQNIKYLDTRYRASYTDLMVFKRNISLTTDIDQKEIYITRLSESLLSSLHYKKTISRLFRNAFV